MSTFTAVVDSPVGRFAVTGTASEVTAIHLPHERRRASPGVAPKAVADAARQLAEYFAGTRRRFAVTLADVPATPFTRDVWQALAAIPYGEVRTYGEVALEAGHPRAHRAVGNANHMNPYPVVVPCHRVVASNGLGGYGDRLDVKQFLLELEGVEL